MKTIKIGDDPSVYATGNDNCKTSTTGTSDQKPKELDWEKVAFLFHNTYEGLATKFGYETRKDTKEFDPESNNGKLMIATCKAVISKTIQQQREDLIKEIEGIVKENRKGTFTDEGGNDCWYIDDLVKELKVLEKK